MVLGPLPASDPRFMRRIRVHQAWYRAAILGIDGYGRLAGSGKLCGTVLPDDAAKRYLNFLGSDAVERYTERRTLGWGVDPERCTKYLTSSQTLSFNMLAQAVGRATQCAGLFNELLGRADLVRLEASSFEFAAQGSKYSLGDKTLLDLLLWFRTASGSVQVVAVETKLADRFSTRRTAGMRGPKYLDLGKRSGMWLDLDAALSDNRTRQLTRCHALAESVQRHDGAQWGHAVLLVLTHPDDKSGAECVRSYVDRVALPQAVAHQSWRTFLSVAELHNAIDGPATAELSRRYVDLAWSDEAWIELERVSGLEAVERRNATWR